LLPVQSSALQNLRMQRSRNSQVSPINQNLVS